MANNAEIEKTVEEIKQTLRFKGKNHFYFEETEKQKKIDDQIDKAIEKYITKEYLKTGNYMNLPRFSELEYNILKLQIFEELLRREGATDEEIQELEEAASEAGKILMEEHKKHVESFTAI